MSPLNSHSSTVRLEYLPSPCLCVDIGGIIDHDFFFGSKHSTVLRVFKPSRPPTTYSLLSMTATPNWRRRPFMLATSHHLLTRRSYLSMLVAPKMSPTQRITMDKPYTFAYKQMYSILFRKKRWHLHAIWHHTSGNDHYMHICYP